MSEDNKVSGNLKGSLMFFLAAMIWGSAFVAQSTGMEHVGPFTFLCCRSYIGFIVLALLMPVLGRIRSVSRVEASRKKGLFKAGLIVGIVLCVSSALQQFGVKYTTVGKAGFITSLYVIIVPIVSLFLLKRRQPKHIWLCAVMAAFGMALLCLSGSLSLQLGDILVLLCAISFSGHILVIDHFVKEYDPVHISCLQFLFCGIISTVLMLIFEHPTWSAISSAMIPILYAGVMSSGVGYTLQAVGQKTIQPTLGAIIMCLESVFSVIFGWIILGQKLSIQEGIGCVIMFAAIVLAQFPGRTQKN